VKQETFQWKVNILRQKVTLKTGSLIFISPWVFVLAFPQRTTSSIHLVSFFFFKWKAICFNSLLQMGFRRAIDYRAISLKWNIMLSKSLWWPSPCWTAYDITSLFHHQAYRAQKNVYLTCQELWQWTKSYAWFRRYWSGDNNCNNVAVYYCTTH